MPSNLLFVSTADKGAVHSHGPELPCTRQCEILSRHVQTFIPYSVHSTAKPMTVCSLHQSQKHNPEDPCLLYMVTFTINIPQMLAYNSIYCLTPSFAQCCSILPGIRHRDHCEAPGRIRLQDGPPWYVQVIGALRRLEVMEVSQNRCTLNHPSHWTILLLKTMILGYTHLKKTPYYINVYTMRYNEDVHGLASSFASSGILWVYTLYRLYLSSTS